MPINDYTCKSCKVELKDEFHKPKVCLDCGCEEFELTTNWSERKCGSVMRGRYMTDQKTINEFSARDDALCQIELGMRSGGHGSLKTFNEDQQKYYQGKIAAGEDSPRLRQQMLDERDRNVKDRRLAKGIKT